MLQKQFLCRNTLNHYSRKKLGELIGSNNNSYISYNDNKTSVYIITCHAVSVNNYQSISIKSQNDIQSTHG